jgi:hypothetical protein
MESKISNPNFAKEMDYAPKQVYKNAKQQYTDLMSGNFSWEQAVSAWTAFAYIPLILSPQDLIAEDPDSHGTMFAPIVLGSDKTTVSVATGQNEYYPLDASLGSVHNNFRHAHHNADVHPSPLTTEPTITDL